MRIFYLLATFIPLHTACILGSQSGKERHNILVFGEKEVGKTVLIAGLRGHRLYGDKNHVEIGDENDPSKDKWAKKVRENFIFIEKSEIDDEVCRTAFKGVLVVDYSNASHASHLTSVVSLMKAFDLSKQPNPPFCLVISVGSQEPDHYGGLHRLVSMCKKIDSPEKTPLYKEERGFFDITLRHGVDNYPATPEKTYEEAGKTEQEKMLEEIKSKGNQIVIFDPFDAESMKAVVTKLNAFIKGEGVSKAAFLQPNRRAAPSSMPTESKESEMRAPDVISDIEDDGRSPSAPVTSCPSPNRQHHLQAKRAQSTLNKDCHIDYPPKNDVQYREGGIAQGILYAGALPLLAVAALLAYFSLKKERKSIGSTRSRFR